MQSFLLTLGYGTAALFGVAVLVAWWEHWSRKHRSKPFEDFPPPAAGPVRVDVDLVTLDAVPGTEQLQRQQTLDATLAHAARASGAPTSASAWTETRPMVGPGTGLAPKAQPIAASDGA